MKVIKEMKAGTLTSLFYGAKLVIKHNPDYLFQMLRMHSVMKPRTDWAVMNAQCYETQDIMCCFRKWSLNDLTFSFMN